MVTGMLCCPGSGTLRDQCAACRAGAGDMAVYLNLIRLIIGIGVETGGTDAAGIVGIIREYICKGNI